MDSQNPLVLQTSRQLEAGKVPSNFEDLSTSLEKMLEENLHSMDEVIIHNIFTQHFNLPLTAALVRLLDKGMIRNCVAWCHDFTWTSSHSRSRVYPGYPWDLLRTYRQDVTCVTVSHYRQKELAGLFNCPTEHIHVAYDGVDSAELYSLSKETKIMASYGMSIKLKGTMEEVKVRLTQALKTQGFGIFTEIDVKKTLNEKIGVDFKPYLILGVCNPKFAFRALSVDESIGLLLPCNVVIKQDGPEVGVSIQDPEAMFSVVDDITKKAMAGFPEEVKASLQKVLATLIER